LGGLRFKVWAKSSLDPISTNKKLGMAVHNSHASIKRRVTVQNGPRA
jgi:hypothetical protein